MLSMTNEQFRQYVSDLKRTKDIKEYVKTTIGNLKELYDEVSDDDAYQCSNLYSLGDAINILELLTKE